MTLCAADMLALIFADCDRSSSTEASVLSLSASDTPPMRSAAFSRSASQRAASLVAPRSESTYTEDPDTALFAMESACTETKRSAFAARARRMRSRKRQELIPIARQYGAHARFAVDASRQCPGDREHDILFVHPRMSGGARILATVARIHGDDDVPAGLAGCMGRQHLACAPNLCASPTSARCCLAPSQVEMHGQRAIHEDRESQIAIGLRLRGDTRDNALRLRQHQPRLPRGHGAVSVRCGSDLFAVATR